MNKKLQIYKQTLPHILENCKDTQTRITVVSHKNDETARVLVEVHLADTSHETKILEIYTGLRHGKGIVWLCPLISELRIVNRDDLTIRTGQSEQKREVFIRSRSKSRPEGIVALEFLLWGCNSPPQGRFPYLHKDFSLSMHFFNCRNGTKELFFNVDIGQLASSTQGNYILAYPSNLSGDIRRTAILYTKGDKVIFNCRTQWREPSPLPWIVVLKALIAVIILMIISAYSRQGISDRNVIVLISSLFGFVYFANDAYSNNQNATVYRSYSNFTKTLSRLCLSTVFMVYAFGVFNLLNNLYYQTYFVYFSTFVSGFFLVLMGIVSFLVHANYLDSFSCDILGCSNNIRLRNGKKECHYTGRVVCRKCFNTICKKCIHREDVRHLTTITASEYVAANLVCMATNKYEEQA